MLRLGETKGTIYKAEKAGNMVKASMQTAKKVNDKWENMWWNVRFVGVNKDEILKFEDKTKIKVLSGTVESNKSNDKVYTNVVIFDYEIVEGKSKEPAEEEEFSF